MADEQLASCPVLILGNKIDMPGAASEDYIRQYFGLYGQTTGQGNVAAKDLSTRPMELFMCSVLKRQGYGEGFRWLANYIQMDTDLQIWICIGRVQVGACTEDKDKSDLVGKYHMTS